MIKVRFDVDDSSLRDTFLRTFFFGALDALRPDTPALWGHMTAQQMVEHLTWTFEVSTGRVLLACPYPEEQREKMKPFLHGCHHLQQFGLVEVEAPPKETQ